MHSDWFNGIEILQGKWQHGEKVVYCYHSGLEKTLFKWDIYIYIYIPLVTKGLLKKMRQYRRIKHLETFTGHLFSIFFYFENEEFYSATSVSCNQNMKSHLKKKPSHSHRCDVKFPKNWGCNKRICALRKISSNGRPNAVPSWI